MKKSQVTNLRDEGPKLYRAENIVCGRCPEYDFVNYKVKVYDGRLLHIY